MSSNEEIVRDLLAADSTLVSLLTGGFYAYSDTTRSGFSRIVTPQAYNQNVGTQQAGNLKPLVVVKERAMTPRQGITDESTGYITTQQVIELWFYEDGDSGYSIIEQARDRAFSLLNNVPASQGFQYMWSQDVNNLRDTELNEASLIRSDYRFIGYKSA